ncbi:MAG: CehA/McbA family metallohydrolase [Methanobacteriota archaeon]|nr:MAG: CehA/McbA family metallohydrolase [Euryarchaeota archaeon]
MKIDLHTHSTHSNDGTASPAEIVRACRKAGLDGLAITDHNVLTASAEAVELGGQEGLVVVRGVEISAAEGHVLAYGLSSPVRAGMAVEETIDAVHSAGGIAVAAHPKRFPSGMGLATAMRAPFDAVEVMNGGSSPRANASALRAAASAGKSKTGGSDAHRLIDVGKAWTVVEGASSEDDVIQAIVRGSTSVGGRGRDVKETVTYCVETTCGWVRRGFRRL